MGERKGVVTGVAPDEGGLYPCGAYIGLGRCGWNVLAGSAEDSQRSGSGFVGHPGREPSLGFALEHESHALAQHSGYEDARTSPTS